MSCNCIKNIESAPAKPFLKSITPQPLLHHLHLISSFSGSKSTYDSLVWMGFFDLSKLLKKYWTCRSFRVLKILTGYRPYSYRLYYFPSKFPPVPKRESHKQQYNYEPEIHVSYLSIIGHNSDNCPPKLFKLAFDS